MVTRPSWTRGSTAGSFFSIMKTTIRIYRKRLYAKRYRLRPDELGLARIYNTLDPATRRTKLEPDIFIRKTKAALT
jgi:hypothetical protein